MNIYLWTEDRENKAGYTFWKTMMGCLYPHIIVESKQNNIGLLKAVKQLVKSEPLEDKYIIAMDESFDNDQVVREMRALKCAISGNHNIYVLRLISFEYILLSFTELLNWIYAENDDFREKRSTEISAREAVLAAIEQNMDYKSLAELKRFSADINDYNIEQLISKLLFRLTRNTGFEVSKGMLGECWQNSCCEYSVRKPDDLCGLDTRRLSLMDKAKTIYKCSILKPEFERLKIGGQVKDDNNF